MLCQMKALMQTQSLLHSNNDDAAGGVNPNIDDVDKDVGVVVVMMMVEVVTMGMLKMTMMAKIWWW